MGQMPKVSKETATQVQDSPMVEDRHEQLEGYTVNFISIRQDADLAPMLRGLPDDRCQCPHWGYVFKGRLTLSFGDHEEVFGAGDAFYIPSGHTPRAEGGTEFLQFSPSEELKIVEAAIMNNMRQMQSASA
jgi:mannose-6-phosphate isomerase-like protein (cupin superfamily)